MLKLVGCRSNGQVISREFGLAELGITTNSGAFRASLKASPGSMFLQLRSSRFTEAARQRSARFSSHMSAGLSNLHCEKVDIRDSKGLGPLKLIKQRPGDASPINLQQVGDFYSGIVLVGARSNSLALQTPTEPLKCPRHLACRRSRIAQERNESIRTVSRAPRPLHAEPGACRQRRKVPRLRFHRHWNRQDDAEAGRTQWRKSRRPAPSKLPKLAAFLDEAEADVLAYMSFSAPLAEAVLDSRPNIFRVLEVCWEMRSS